MVKKRIRNKPSTKAGTFINKNHVRSQHDNTLWIHCSDPTCIDCGDPTGLYIYMYNIYISFKIQSLWNEYFPKQTNLHKTLGPGLKADWCLFRVTFVKSPGSTQRSKKATYSSLVFRITSPKIAMFARLPAQNGLNSHQLAQKIQNAPQVPPLPSIDQTIHPTKTCW